MTIEKNNLEIPDYLDKKFFKDALENDLKTNNIEIISLNFTMGSNAGDNYTSNIYRVVINYSDGQSSPQTTQLIIKSIPKGEQRYLMEYLNGHTKEEKMLFEIIPKMEALLTDTKLAPKCFYAIDEPLQTIVFEDLKASNYSMADREKGLDEKQCKLVLEKLAKFHASSMQVAAEHPHLLESLSNGFFTSFTMNTPLVQSFFVDILLLEISVIEKWEGYEKIASKLKNVHKTMVERCVAAAKPIENELKVLNHGDMWVNNFMFQYANDDTENPLDVLFYDYQGSYYVSPGIDINYFLNTSIQLEVLENRRDFMIEEYYYKSFRSSLERIGFEKIPSLDEIKEEIRKREFYGFVAAVGVLPIVCMDRHESTDNSLESFADKEIAANKQLVALSSKRFKQIMKYMLDRGDKLGVFD